MRKALLTISRGRLSRSMPRGSTLGARCEPPVDMAYAACMGKLGCWHMSHAFPEASDESQYCTQQISQKSMQLS